MSVMFEVYHKKPVDESREDVIRNKVSEFGGEISHREEDTLETIILRSGVALGRYVAAPLGRTTIAH